MKKILINIGIGIIISSNMVIADNFDTQEQYNAIKSAIDTNDVAKFRLAVQNSKLTPAQQSMLLEQTKTISSELRNKLQDTVGLSAYNKKNILLGLYFSAAALVLGYEYVPIQFYNLADNYSKEYFTFKRLLYENCITTVLICTSAADCAYTAIDLFKKGFKKNYYLSEQLDKALLIEKELQDLIN